MCRLRYADDKKIADREALPNEKNEGENSVWWSIEGNESCEKQEKRVAMREERGQMKISGLHLSIIQKEKKKTEREREKRSREQD